MNRIDLHRSTIGMTSSKTPAWRTAYHVLFEHPAATRGSDYRTCLATRETGSHLVRTAQQPAYAKRIFRIVPRHSRRDSRSATSASFLRLWWLRPTTSTGADGHGHVK